MRRALHIMILVILPAMLYGQYFLEFHTENDNSFMEWEIFAVQDSSEVEGEMDLTWGIKNDFTQWQYRIGDHYGEIYLKFQNNPGFWELSSEDKLVSIRQVWPGDITEWKISHKDRSFVFRPVLPNQLDEWSIKGKELGELFIYTEQLGDPRDWIVEDYTVDELTFEERLAALFIALYVSTPKY